MDSFCNKGAFNASKIKTLLKLTIPRIKLLRNRREKQIRQMRQEIAKLLETNEEATARIQVEEIIKEEKMVAAQEIIELICDLIVARLPIIEARRKCPIDLKEAISSICFAAPRCVDLPELLHVQMLFAVKYGKDFVFAATALMPGCGVNRQLVELLYDRATTPDVKLKLLKEIAEEHELDWDLSASERELLKPYEDLPNGPTQFVSGSKISLPKEKHQKSLHAAASEQTSGKHSDSNADQDSLDFPQVPNEPLRSSSDPFPASALSKFERKSAKPSGIDEGLSEEFHLKPEEKSYQKSVPKEFTPNNSVLPLEEKQFLAFILSSEKFCTTFSVKQNNPSPFISGMKSETNVDLQDVLAAAQDAADTAERAVDSALAAANLAQIRISELVKKRRDVSDSTLEKPLPL